MLIDNISIIISIIGLLLTTVSIVANPFFRSVGQSKSNDDKRVALPPFTIVVLSLRNSDELEKHLPTLLAQHYEPGYEVVVVGEKGDLDIEAVIGKYSSDHKLYATYIPKRSLFMSKPKLAASLGIKAAHNEWIVMLDDLSEPASELWLKSIAENIDENTNLVIGYSNYNEGINLYRRFIRLREACYRLRSATKGMAYRSTGTNVAFKRSEFIASDGYRGNLQHVFGEYDFIVNKFARRESSAIAMSPESFIFEDCPTKKKWKERCIADYHVGRQLARNGRMRAIHKADNILLYLNYAAIISAILFGIATYRYIAVAIGGICLITTLALRIWLVKKKCRIFTMSIPAWRIPFYELSVAWFDTITRLRYAKADKHDFSTHKI